MAHLGIIGLGQFGSFAAAHLAPHLDVVAYDPRPPTATIPRVELVDLPTAASAEFVVVCVPVQALTDTLDTLRPYLASGACVLDTCSVKVAPMAWLEETLPPDVDYVGTHPLFGPRSAGDGLDGHRVVLCPGRGEHVECVAEFLRDLGLYVIITDPDTHDRESARAQALAQYVGRGLRAVELPESDISTYAAELLRETQDIVAEDSWELFAAIQNLNPYAAEARQQLRDRLNELDERLGKS